MKKWFLVFLFVIVGLGLFVGIKMTKDWLKKGRVSAELEKELSHCPLEITGEVPTWLEGTLIRNGPVYVQVNGQTNAHWFDGLAMLHAFHFSGGKVNYSNKFLRTEAYKTVFKKGSLDYTGFASDPCRSLFKRFFTHFFPSDDFQKPNANVNVAKLADAYVALTEIPLPVRFDLTTLETLGVLNYTDELPHKKCWESAHPHEDKLNHETVNYLIEYGRQSHYVLYRLKEGSSQREVIGRVPTAEPAYMHSFALTEHYAVFTEFPFVVKPLDLITKGLPFIKNFTWHPERGTHFTVVNRSTGALVGRYKTRSFFAFHHANAFEKDENLYLDLVTYPDPRIIEEVATYENPQMESSLPERRFERFILSLKTGKIESHPLCEASVEFPRINETKDGQPYRFVYLTDPRELSLDDAAVRPLYKVDVENQQILAWAEGGCCPGEPLFIPSPSAMQEDDGVVLAVVLDLSRHRSFLLILDGKSLQEIARAEVSHAIPAGLHGQFFPH